MGGNKSSNIKQEQHQIFISPIKLPNSFEIFLKNKDTILETEHFAEVNKLKKCLGINHIRFFLLFLLL